MGGQHMPDEVASMDGPLAEYGEDSHVGWEVLEVALASANMGVWLWNPFRRDAIYFSASCCAMLGWHPDEFAPTAEAWLSLVHADDRRGLEEAFRRFIQSPDDVGFRHEHRVRGKDGQWRWILASGKVVARDDDGRVRRVVGVNIDVTEQKRVDYQECLRREILEKLARGADLAVLLDAIARGVEAGQPGAISSVMLVDDDGHLHVGAAPSLPRFFYAPIEGAPIGEGVGTCGTAAFRGERVIIEDIRTHPYWSAASDVAQQVGVAACWSQPVFDSRGRVVATVAMYSRSPGVPGKHDLELLEYSANLAAIAIERKREEKARASLEERLRRAHEMEALGRMAGRIAHEINNVLQPVMSHASLASHACAGNEEASIHVTKIKESVRHGREIVRSVLAIAGGQAIVRQPCQLETEIARLMALIVATVRPDITVETALQPTQGMVSLSATELFQILDNLVVNSSDAIAATGRIRVATGRVTLGDEEAATMGVAPGSYARLTVSDTGGGMDEDTLRRAFDPFFTTKPINKGSGLGLSTVRALVESMGGGVHISSAPGQGTQARVVFPFVR
jgi:PAS domain S-box-containing protein